MDEFLAVLENLVAYFVQRQRIVALAMLDIHPTALGGKDGKFLDINIEPYRDIQRAKMHSLWESEDKKATHQLFEGVWKSDWKFIRHGIGCKLINLRSSEPIEWDAPDPHAIDLYWFLANLEWRLTNEADDPFVGRCQQWLEVEHSDLNGIRRALYLLINRGILFLRQDHKCRLATQRDVHRRTVPEQVSQAVQNLIVHYKERQQIVIAAMVELRPDIVKVRADERFMDPGVISRLRALIANSENDFKGWSFVKGTWGNDSWNYDLGHTRLTIMNKATGEPLTWAASDPLAIEVDGFRQHLKWRIENQSDEENIKTCTDWYKTQTQTYRQARISGEDENWLLDPWTLLEDMIEQQVIVLKQDDYGLMIK